MKKIIAISGKQYSGKDTVAKLIISAFPDFKRIGIGDAIKIEYGRRNNLSFDEIEKNKPEHRAALIALGNEGRAKDKDYWLRSLLNLENDIIIPDLRVLHEVEIFKKAGAFTLRVEASESTRAKRGIITNASDLTETALDNYTAWDFVLDNNSDYDALKDNIKPLFAEIKKYFYERI